MVQNTLKEMEQETLRLEKLLQQHDEKERALQKAMKDGESTVQKLSEEMTEEFEVRKFDSCTCSIRRAIYVHICIYIYYYYYNYLYVYLYIYI